MIKHKITPELGPKVAKIAKVKDNTITFEIQNDGCVQAEANYGLQLILHFLFSQQKASLEQSHFVEDNVFCGSEIDFIYYLRNMRFGSKVIISKEEYEAGVKRTDEIDHLAYSKKYFEIYIGDKMDRLTEKHTWFYKEIPPFYKLFTEWAEKCISKLTITNETFSMSGNNKVYNYQLQLEMDKEFRFLVQHLQKSTWEEVKCYDFKDYFY